MASSSCFLSAASLAFPSPSLYPSGPPQQPVPAAVRGLGRCVCRLLPPLPILRRSRQTWSGAVCMAAQEPGTDYRFPQDFPGYWQRPIPARRPDIFPKLCPRAPLKKTPLPRRLPIMDPSPDEDFEPVGQVWK